MAFVVEVEAVDGIACFLVLVIGVEAEILEEVEDGNAELFSSCLDYVDVLDEGLGIRLLHWSRGDLLIRRALEVAMGGRMKNIVVDDEDVARTCIDYLKSARAGRATFLPLNKIKRAPNSLNPPNVNGVIDYAVNLIDFDDQYYDAFYHALGDTLIVEDRMTAQKLIGKYRMVVLDGSLYEKWKKDF